MKKQAATTTPLSVALPQKATCQQHSTASNATGWHTKEDDCQNGGPEPRLPPGRFDGSVLIARPSARLGFLCKALSFSLLLTAVTFSLQTSAFPSPFTVVAQSTAAKASLQSVTVPFELVNKHMVLKVRVNNSRPLSFVLDTGDQFAIIDLELAKTIGLSLGAQVKVGGAGAATQSGAFVKDASFTIPQLPGFSQRITMALPIRTLAPRLGQDFDGIIGSEFIEQFVVEIDYINHELKLHKKDRFSYDGPGDIVPIQLRHGHPIVDATVTPAGTTPLKGKFVLDLGAGLALALYSPFVTSQQLLKSDIKTIKSLGGAGAGGETVGEIGRVLELTIGRFKIDQPITLFSQDKAGAFADAGLSGNIGARIASKFRLFLDYDRKRIIFEPNKTFDQPFDQAQSGMSLVAEGADYRIFRVRRLMENSPASEAGIQQDDIIESVNGESAKQFTLSRLNEMFERPERYKLTIRRNETMLERVLIPRRMI